ncbi:hypothetical protein ACJX0J_012793, partial [Zea mays]
WEWEWALHRDKELAKISLSLHPNQTKLLALGQAQRTRSLKMVFIILYKKGGDDKNKGRTRKHGRRKEEASALKASTYEAKKKDAMNWGDDVVQIKHISLGSKKMNKDLHLTSLSLFENMLHDSIRDMQ